MPQYDCGSWMHITAPKNGTLAIHVYMQHDIVHPHYSDISLPGKV